MDGLGLFRKLGRGAKFNLKKFQNDAEKLNLVSKSTTTNTEKKKHLDFFAQNRSSSELTADDDDEVHEPMEKRMKFTHTDDNDDDDDDDNDDDEDDLSEEDESEDEEELEILGNIKSTKATKDKMKKKSGRMSAREKTAYIKQEKVNHCRNQNHIHIYGTDIPDPVESFNQLQSVYNLHPKIIENIKSAGYTKPTPIQMQAIPVMMTHREILACAPTGSGKTAAFLIPIIHHLKEPRNVGFRALLLAPTRELAQQTYRECCRLAEGRGIRVHFIEKATEATIKKLSSKAGLKLDILVTTPNRLLYLIKQEPPAIKLNSVEWLIVDESDKLFEEGKTGFRDQLAEIYKACDSTNVRRGMFSATFAHDVEQWCKLNLDNLVSVYIGARNSATKTIEQQLLFVGSESGKMIAVRDIVRTGLTPPVLIFVQSKDRAKELFHELIYDGINVDVIHADRTQQQRENVIKCFRSGSIWVLICTDLMGRGIDFKGVNLVINYDFPTSAISYIHRIGRTGRAGRKGKAVTFFTEQDTLNLRSIANVMKGAGCPIPDYMLKLKRPSKEGRKKLEKNIPVREEITTVPLHDRQKMNYKRACIERSKKKQIKKSQSSSSKSGSSATVDTRKRKKKMSKKSTT